MGTNDISTKDEFRIEWLIDGNIVGYSPEIWQKRETAEYHAEQYIEVMKDEFGIVVPNLEYRIKVRLYNVNRMGWQ